MAFWNKQRGRRTLGKSLTASLVFAGLAMSATAVHAQQPAQPAQQAKPTEAGTSWFKLCKDNQKATAGVVSVEKACTTHFEMVGAVPGYVSVAVDIAHPPGQPDKVQLTVQVPSLAQLPFGYQPALRPGVRLEIDKEDPLTVPYSFCHVNGCIATATGEKAIVDKFKKGSRLKVVVYGLNGKPRTHGSISLNGFTKAYEGEPYPIKTFEEQRKAAIKLVQQQQAELRKRAQAAAAAKAAQQGGQAAPAQAAPAPKKAQ